MPRGRPKGAKNRPNPNPPPRKPYGSTPGCTRGLNRNREKRPKIDGRLVNREQIVSACLPGMSCALSDFEAWLAQYNESDRAMFGFEGKRVTKPLTEGGSVQETRTYLCDRGRRKSTKIVTSSTPELLAGALDGSDAEEARQSSDTILGDTQTLQCPAKLRVYIFDQDVYVIRSGEHNRVDGLHMPRSIRTRRRFAHLAEAECQTLSTSSTDQPNSSPTALIDSDASTSTPENLITQMLIRRGLDPQRAMECLAEMTPLIPYMSKSPSRADRTPAHLQDRHLVQGVVTSSNNAITSNSSIDVADSVIDPILDQQLPLQEPLEDH